MKKSIITFVSGLCVLSCCYGDPPSVAEIPAPQNLHRLNVKIFGAKGDGRVFRDGMVTFGSPVLTSADGAAFAPSDIGRTIIIDLNNTSRQITTITAVGTNGATATLAANALGTAAAATCYLGTDDTSAIQNAINACYDAGGGIVYIPTGLYILAGGLKDTTERNSVLLVPNPDIAAAQPIRTIDVEGETPANAGYSGYFAYPTSTNGSVLYFGTPGSGVNPSAICGNATNWSSVNFVIRNIDIRLPQNPTIGGLNFSKGGGLSASNVSVVADRSNLSVNTMPSTNTVGIWLPGPSNNGLTVLQNFWVQNIGVGGKSSDHAHWDHGVFAQCAVGLHIDEGLPTHLNAVQFVADAIDIDVSPTAANPAVIGSGIDFESDGITTTHISDTNGVLSGQLSLWSDVALLNFKSVNLGIQAAGNFYSSAFSLVPFVNYSTTTRPRLQAATPACNTGWQFLSSTGVVLGEFLATENFGQQCMLIGRNGTNIFLFNSEANGLEIPTGGDGSPTATAGNFVIATPGKTLLIQGGANGKAGVFTLASGSATVGNTSIDANSVVMVTLKAPSGTRSGNPDVVCTPGVGFTATGGTGDNSTYNYVILEVNP